VFPLVVPPLRERRDDIPLLVEYFTFRLAKRAGKKIKRIGKETLSLLRSYNWPGNVRELQNVVERVVIVSESDALYIDERWLFGRRSIPRLTVLPQPGTPVAGTLAAREKAAIEER
jgi:formate hydrogenlyase transcriptional activator